MMHITANERSIDYWRRHYEDCPRVLVDGREILGVAAADDTEGYVVHYFHDVQGRIGIERIAGRVEIIGNRRHVDA
jgi:hypothetical protein